jgi:hypothetical protein
LHARTLFEVESCEKLRRDKDFKIVKEKHWNICAMECLKIGVAQLHRRQTSSAEEHLVILKESPKGRIDGQDLVERICKNPVSHWICQRSKEVTTAFGVQAPGVMSHWIVDQLPASRRIGHELHEVYHRNLKDW